MGDPTGVGPEILIKSLSKPETYAICRPLAVGSVSAIERMAGILGSTMRVRAVDPASAAYVHGTIEVYDPWGEDLSDLPFKQVTVEGGRSSAEAVIEAAKLVMAGRAAALVTGPIHKEAINRAGYHYAGHTELLADLTGTPGTRMLLVAPIAARHSQQHPRLAARGHRARDARQRAALHPAAARLAAAAGLREPADRGERAEPPRRRGPAVR